MASIARMHENDLEVPAAQTADDIPARPDLFLPAGAHHAGKIQVSPEPDPAAAGQEAFYPLRIDDVLPGDRVLMYGTIVTVIDAPFRHSPLDGQPCYCQAGYVHLRLVWDREPAMTAERSGLLFGVSRPGHG